MRTRLSVKKLALPQKELMFRYQDCTAGNPHHSVEEIRPEGSAIVFGVSPCDARALSLTALVFMNGSEKSPGPTPTFKAG
jgi:hypothetical protein